MYRLIIWGFSKVNNIFFKCTIKRNCAQACEVLMNKGTFNYFSVTGHIVVLPHTLTKQN